MKKWFQKIGEKMSSFMYGRYGYDELSRAISTASLLLLLVSCFDKLRFFLFPALVLWVWGLIRCCSKNLTKRQRERAAYLQITGKIKGWFSLKKRMWSERKTHCYIKCGQCAKMLRVPKGKGKIKITCPQCHTEIIKKT